MRVLIGVANEECKPWKTVIGEKVGLGLSQLQIVYLETVIPKEQNRGCNFLGVGHEKCIRQQCVYLRNLTCIF